MDQSRGCRKTLGILPVLATLVWETVTATALMAQERPDTVPPPPPNAPLSLELVYTGDALSAVRGGNRSRVAYSDNLDLKIRLDGSRFGQPKLRGLIYLISNRGKNPSEFVGDAQGVSNVAAEPFWTLFEAWLQLNLLDSRLSVLTGLYDLNSEFDAIQSAAVFLNSSFGTGPDLAQSGLNGPSIFPTASLGVRLKWRPTAWYYVEAAVLDGVPGDPASPGGLRVKLSEQDGALLAAEIAFFRGAREHAPLTRRMNVRNRSRRVGRGDAAVRYDGKLAIGGWIYTSRTPSLGSSPGSEERLASRGAYILGEYTMLREPGNGDGLTGFLRVGVARSAVNRFATYAGGGLVYSGIFPGRSDDEVGLAVARAINGMPYRLTAPSGQATPTAETVVELTYRLQAHSLFAIQPDLQWVINPGTVAGRANAVVVGLRGEASVRLW